MAIELEGRAWFSWESVLLLGKTIILISLNSYYHLFVQFILVIQCWGRKRLSRSQTSLSHSNNSKNLLAGNLLRCGVVINLVWTWIVTSVLYRQSSTLHSPSLPLFPISTCQNFWTLRINSLSNSVPFTVLSATLSCTLNQLDCFKIWYAAMMSHTMWVATNPSSTWRYSHVKKIFKVMWGIVCMHKTS